MGIISFNANVTGLVGDQVNPRRITMVSSDNLAGITAAGYLNNLASSFPLLPTDIVDVWYGWTSTDSPGTFGMFTLDFTFVNGSQVITLNPWENPGNVLLPVVSGDFAIFNGTTGQIKDAGYSPSNAAKTKVVMANGTVIANHIGTFTDTAGTLGDDAVTAINGGNIQAGLSGTAGILSSFPAGATSGSLRLVGVASAGDYLVSISNSSFGQASVISIPDPGASTANFILSAVVAGQSVSSSSASATPGTVRALKGLMILSNATYANTTNSVAGVRGEVDMVGASSGFIYGVQGKVVPTGTLSGSIWAPAVFGQYDLSAATINAGQIAAIWGDMGATGGTFTDVTGARMFAGTNTIASLTLNSMIYLYGKASNLFELSGSSSTYISAGAATPSGDLKKIAITIDGVVHYILAAAVWS